MASTITYASAEELRARIEKDKNASDGVLASLLFSASRAVDQYTNRREDGYVAPATATARDFVGSGRASQMIEECVEVASVAVKASISDSTYTAWAAGTWLAARGGPDFPKFYGTPYDLLVVDVSGSSGWSVFTSGGGVSASHLWPDTVVHEHDIQIRQPTVRVTARWGYATEVPGPIKEATIMQASRWFERLKVGMADSLATTDLGELRFTQDLDPDVQFLLRLGRWIRPPMME
jgi:hypothetical protein